MTTAPAACPKCGAEFLPKRRNQTYCGRACQKNAAAVPRRIATSPAARRRQETRSGRAWDLAHALYETPHAYRAAFLQALIEQARRNVELRNIVTARGKLESWTRHSGTGRLHIAHLLDHYCREVYNMRSFEAVDPAKMLPPERGVIFPYAYFGPDHRTPFVYTDGSLTYAGTFAWHSSTLRPCNEKEAAKAIQPILQTSQPRQGTANPPAPYIGSLEDGFRIGHAA